jgi:hypothetical protein
MKTHPSYCLALALWAFTPSGFGQTGPFPPEAWPPTVDPSKVVHYFVAQESLAAPNDNWVPSMTVLSGGDQITEDISIGGFGAKKVIGSFLNVADNQYEAWAEEEFIDILVQAYGDAALFNAEGAPRNFNFLTGILPELAAPVGGQVPVEARNRKWNWILFRIPNGIRESDGSRLIGSIPANAQGSFGAGGVNGGTIRFEGVPNLIVRAVAFGQEGAFGTPEAINLFAPADSCDPEPETNLVGIDINSNVSRNIEILNDGDQTVTFEENVGPTTDPRRVVRPDGLYLNFGVTDQFLGQPCNDPRTVKVCIQFYDDPAYAGAEVRFGPEAYATDNQGGIGFVAPERRHLMQGTGTWIRRSWVIPAVSLQGVNAGAFTAGPRFVSENAQVAVSHFDLAVLRVGEHPLAGQDPLAGCVEDPLICTDAYGQLAELDLGLDIRNGIDLGSSGGDQEMIVEEAGPASDRRQAVRPAREDGTAGFTHQYLNFAITEQALGPNSQPPAQLAICVTYYDDPALVGATFRPEVYQTERNGSGTLGFTDPSVAVTLQGTDTWRQAYWMIPDMKFLGVNQGPQAAARFTVSDKVFITRVRYGVIRPCGPDAGVNPLAECVPPPSIPLEFARLPSGQVEIRWPAAATGFLLQSTPALDTPWANVPDAPTVDGEDLVVLVTPEGTRFYQLFHP